MSVFGKIREVCTSSGVAPGKPLAAAVLLTETRGLTWGSGLPTLYANLNGLVIPGKLRDSVRISLLAERSHATAREGRPPSERQWEERVSSVSETELRRLLDVLCGIGFPDRPPRVRGVVDTSIAYTTVSLAVRVNDEPWSFAVSMQSSGFDGEDANGVRELCRALFALVEYDEFDPIVYGRPAE